MLPLLLLEGMCRIGSTLVDDVRGPEEEAEEWFAWNDDLGWVPRPGYTGPVFSTFRAYDGDGYLTADTAQVADKTTPRS